MKCRETTATDAEKAAGQEALQALMEIVNKCMMRRTSQINNKFLPQKIEFIVCVHMKESQVKLYEEVVDESNRNKRGRISSIQKLRKVVNHPDLLIQTTSSNGGLLKASQSEVSGKLHFLQLLISRFRQVSNDKLLIVSNYTQTLDLLDRYFRVKKYGTIRLDGTMSSRARTKVVDRFNEE